MVVVMIQFYAEPDAGRRRELEACLRFNLQHRAVTRLVDLSECSSPHHVPDDVRVDRKYWFVPLSRRATFADFFGFAAKALPKDTAVCLLNADVFLSPFCAWWPRAAGDFRFPSAKLGGADREIAYCLSRIELIPPVRGILAKPPVPGEPPLVVEHRFTLFQSGSLMDMSFAHSQDGWIWRNPAPAMEDVGFGQGNPGCDNAIAERFHRAGLLPVNRGDLYQLIHFDHARKPHDHAKLVAPKAEAWTFPEERGQLLVPRYDLVSRTPEFDPDAYEAVVLQVSSQIRINNRGLAEAPRAPGGEDGGLAEAPPVPAKEEGELAGAPQTPGGEDCDLDEAPPAPAGDDCDLAGAPQAPAG